MRWMIALLALILLPAGASGAERELPDALKDKDPQELMAIGLGLMQLSDEEKTRFGEIIDAFVQDLKGAIATEMRRNAPNADRRIKKKVTQLFEDLDQRTAGIVSESRNPGYLVFKKGLADQMKPGRK